MWNKIRELLTSLASSTHITDGQSVSDILGRDKNYYKTIMNSLLNQYRSGRIDLPTFLEKADNFKNKRQDFVAYKAKDILNAGRQKLHEVINKTKESLGLIKGYVYESKLEACPICVKKDGLKWKRWADIEPYHKPLIHPNCRCVIVANSEDNDGSFNDLTADEWLELQSKAVKNIIKPRRGKSILEIAKRNLTIGIGMVKSLLN